MRRLPERWPGAADARHLLVAAGVILLLGVSLASDADVLYPTLAVGYAMFLVAVGRAAYERRDAAVLAVAALAAGLAGLLFVPSTWGVSSFLSLIGLPLSVPGLFVPGRARRLSLLALLLNAAAAVVLVALW